MRKKVIYRSVLIVMLLLCLSTITALSYSQFESKVPNDLKIIVGENQKFNLKIPFKAKIKTDDIGVLSVNNSNIPKNQINLNLNEPFTLKSTKLGKYTVNLKLFGIFNWKQIRLDVINKTELIPSGLPIGICIDTDGVMILGTSTILSVDGLNYEPALNILKSGDYIVSIDNVKVINKNQVMQAIQKSEGNDIKLEIRRNGQILTLKIKPVKTPSGEYKIGTWIRDSTEGIGTLTFIDPTGKFGALGHGITDIDTSLLMDIDKGSIYTADIVTIVKGEKGKPGEIVGIINKKEEDKIGEININSNQGIFGDINQNFQNIVNLEPMKIALKQEVQLGKASVLCQVDGEIKEYDIEIEKIDLNNKNKNKGLVLKITDKRLLEITNGIVQGMSGSPIIQNNRLIGAVTHVFVQDSTKGYGTFIENMIKTYDK